MDTQKQQGKRRARARKADAGEARKPQRRPADQAAGEGKTATGDGAAEAVRDEVMEASEESFPASDAPAWIPVRA